MSAGGTPTRVLYAATICWSGFLLFLVQPIIARQILPWFGGGSGVWSVCLAFFQTALVLGYAYANAAARRLAPRTQARVHGVLLLLSLASLPVVASERWRPADATEPTAHIVALLAATVGLPYFMLATTAPLLQTWFARSFPERRVYRLFAVSNLAALVALVAYPFAIEPWVTTRMQAYAWSIGYAVFALGALVVGRGAPAGARPDDPLPGTSAGRPAPERAAASRADRALWIALPAASSWLLVAVTRHLSENVASVPFLWVLPLAIYLASYMACFDADRRYRRRLWLPAALVSVAACAYGLQTTEAALDIVAAIPLYAIALLSWCMFCHGELARLKPRPADLTIYYLLMASGGAMGGIAVGLVVPLVLDSSYELGVGLTLTAALAAVVLGRRFGWRTISAVVPLCAVGVAAFAGYSTHLQRRSQHERARVLARNFYGTLRTTDLSDAGPAETTRRLISGIVLHGEQFLAPDRRREATSYYGATSGIGTLLDLRSAPRRRLGVIGLGAGTLAAYGRDGDVLRFYEINPQVVDVAQSEFTFLRDTAATVEVAIGDGRLLLEREPPQAFDVLAIDAFSGDAIPVHLLTAEAFAVYRRHLKPEGVLAVHVSNRFLDLAPVVALTAEMDGLVAALLVDRVEAVGRTTSDWVVATADRTLFEQPALTAMMEAPTRITGLRPWTDEYHDLLRTLRDVRARQGGGH